MLMPYVNPVNLISVLPFRTSNATRRPSPSLSNYRCNMKTFRTRLACYVFLCLPSFCNFFYLTIHLYEQQRRHGQQPRFHAAFGACTFLLLLHKLMSVKVRPKTKRNFAEAPATLFPTSLTKALALQKPLQ